MGGAVLLIWNDVAPGGDAEFNHWHIREHLPERVGLPGFLRGRRYVAEAGAPRYFTLYETESLAILAGGPYVARLNEPTPWTRTALPLFRNTNRTACRVGATLGHGVGGALATVRLGPAEGRQDELRGWLIATTLPALVDRPGVVGASLCEADLAATRVPTAERGLRHGEDEVARWVLLVEATDSETAEGACRTFLSAEALARRGAATDTAQGIYRLVYCLSK
jgi:hypothetical protein